MPAPRTIADYRRRLAQLEWQARRDAKLIESQRNELLDLRWQLGLNRPAAKDENDVPFEANGNVGTPGYVADYLARLKAEILAKNKHRRSRYA